MSTHVLNSETVHPTHQSEMGKYGTMYEMEESGNRAQHQSRGQITQA